MRFEHDYYDEIMEHLQLIRAETRKHSSELVKEIVSWGPAGRHSIWVEYEDGYREEFNHLDGYTRNISHRDIFQYDDEQTEFPRKLYEMMRDKGFTQTDLAYEAGISQGSISGYLAGSSSPSLDQLRKLARALDCRIIELIDNY